MKRRGVARVAAPLAATAAFIFVTASPAAAHGIGGRVDLPVPKWLFVYGAGTAVVVSFFALVLLWREPKLQKPRMPKPLPAFMQGILRSKIVEWIIRGISVALFVVVMAGALAGNPNLYNIAPVFIYIWFWVGLAFAHGIFGNLWATLSPWDTIARLIGLGEKPVRPYPKAWGMWPGVFVMFGFVWMELVDPNGAGIRNLGVAVVVYSILTLTGMGLFGREEWNRSGEGFAVYFEMLSRIAPLKRDDQGRVGYRAVLSGLPSMPPRPGLVAFVMVLLGSTTFDGFGRSQVWQTWTVALSRPTHALVGTLGLLAFIGAVALVYALAMAAAGAVSGDHWHPTAVRFIHTVVPIAFAYVVAHYFSLLLIEGQQGLSLLSDPVGIGWNIFGTAHWQVNLSIVTPNEVWLVQVVAIVAGHIAGVVLAHDRAIDLYEPKVAMRTQYALLVAMVMFTIMGLFILSGA